MPANLILATTLTVLVSVSVWVSMSVWVFAGQGSTVKPTTPKRGGNPIAAKLPNPVAATEASLAAGRQTYRLLCSRCHGATGKGDGGGAGAGGQPADFTDAVWEFGASDGEIFAAIAEGTSADMESYSDRLQPDEIWNVVNYLRTLKQ